MKFPFVKQLDVMDCGPACIQMIAAFYGKKHPLKCIRDNSSIMHSGVNLLGLSEAAEKIGFRTVGAKLSLRMLEEKANMPCILHWKQEHFVVLYRVKKNCFHIADPALGLIKLSKDEFEQCWVEIYESGTPKGIALFLEPTQSFYNIEPIKYKSDALSYLLRYIGEYRKRFFSIFLLLLAGSLIQLVFPFLTQAIVDKGINANNTNLLLLILVAQIILVFSRSMADIIRRKILLFVCTKVNISFISDFLLKLMKLPMRFFDSKHSGDLIRRIEDHKRIETFLSQSVLNSLFAILSIIVFSIVLVYYNTSVFLIFLAGSFLYVGWISLFMKRRAELDRKNFTQMSTHQDTLMQMIYGMQEIKLTGSEQQKIWEWNTVQETIFSIRKRALTMEQQQLIGGVLINELKNILITYLAALAVINGEITLGIMLSIQFIIGQMQSPIEQLVTFIQQGQDAHLSLERLAEIQNEDNEDNEIKSKDIPPASPIVIENLVFTYSSALSEKVIKNVTLRIPQGKITAVVGLSGSGKTTLIKLILGFYRPSGGEIKIGDRSLQDINLKEWRRKCGVVMQDGFVFNDTITNNIAPGVEKVDMERVRYAARTANIQEYIESLPLKYNTMIGASGRGLSQGQRQRLLIARAVYKDPAFIFFDEATNALDAKNERTILSNLGVFLKNRTALIVAHRLSTVKNADQIVVLDGGEIVEQGRHSDLVRLQGHYYHLVKDQLELGM
jgi:ATP-binding cassette subfamily B protein